MVGWKLDSDPIQGKSDESRGTCFANEMNCQYISFFRDFIFYVFDIACAKMVCNYYIFIGCLDTRQSQERKKEKKERPVSRPNPNRCRVTIFSGRPEKILVAPGLCEKLLLK